VCAEAGILVVADEVINIRSHYVPVPLAAIIPCYAHEFEQPEVIHYGLGFARGNFFGEVA